MLNNVKELIKFARDNEFDFYSYYMQYVMNVQDENLDEEVNFTLRKNTLNIIDISKLLKDNYERTVI